MARVRRLAVGRPVSARGARRAGSFVGKGRRFAEADGACQAEHTSEIAADGSWHAVPWGNAVPIFVYATFAVVMVRVVEVESH